MAVAKMKLVNIVGQLRDFDNVVQQCCIKGDFHPEMSSQAVEHLDAFQPVEEVNPYEHAMQSAVDIGVHSDIPLHYSKFDQLGMTYEELASYIDKAQQELAALNGKVYALTQSADRLEQVLTALTHIKDFGISLDTLFGCKNVVFRFGRLPKESYYKLSGDDAHDDRLFFPLEEDELYFWGFYVAKKTDEQDSEAFYASLYFESIHIIENAHGTPAQAYERIQAELTSARSRLSDAKAAVDKYWADHRDTYLKVYSNLRYLHDSFDMRRYASKCDDSFYVFGWVPEREIGAFTKRFDKLSGVDCIVESTDDAEEITPPTKLVNNRLAKPFEMFVGMYGLPVYNEIDPTPFMAITYSIIFGIMFGDLGQGAIVFALGLFLAIKKKLPLGSILARIGVSSMVFGFLFNSVFGSEDIIPFKDFLPHHATAIIPVHATENTIYVLGATIALGIILILVCMGLNIANGIRQKNVEKLFFSENGLSGLTFYVTILVSCVFSIALSRGVSPLIIIFLIILPILIIGLKEPLTKLVKHKKDWKPTNIFEFFISSFFELFEILLSFATNTISFVRIGAYIMSHAGMMTVAFAFAKLAGNGVGSIPVLIFCNAFVMLLEGFVVAIQCIRLQYYEIFSRFYDGTGKEFSPVTIHYE